MYMGCSYIYNTEHRNLRIRKTLNDFLVQVRNLLWPLSLKVLRHKEREAQSFYLGFFICPPLNTCGTRHKGHWPSYGEQAKANCLLPRQVSTLLTDFFKISQNLLRSYGVWRHPYSVTPLPMWAIVISLSDMSAALAHARTRNPSAIMLH